MGDILSLGIALDLGTSGFRAELLEIKGDGKSLGSAVMTSHPLPGHNVMDHLEFAVNEGVGHAQRIIIGAVNRLVDSLCDNPLDVSYLAICGNPIQLSLFQGIEIRDLAYPGKSKQKALGVTPPKRGAKIIDAERIEGLKLSARTRVLVPPSVAHEIGADTLAMIIKTGLLERDECAIAIDYGTNAEIALKFGTNIYTGSTAAGPAMEGQHLESGMIALPGAICNVQTDSGILKTWVIDDTMTVRKGGAINAESGESLSSGDFPCTGITGTGVIALLDQGIRSGLICLPKINTPEKTIKLPGGGRFTEKDLLQVGRAVGAMRAGQIVLCKEAATHMDDIETAYLCGAGGTYVDPIKAQRIGLFPKGAKKIYQAGNTSIAMAMDLVQNPERLGEMQDLADLLKKNHCIFAQSDLFNKAYINELSYWNEGMPDDLYLKFMKRYGLPYGIKKRETPLIKRLETGHHAGVERKLNILDSATTNAEAEFIGCSGCRECIKICPENALQFNDESQKYFIGLSYGRCRGYSCKKCEKSCPENVFFYRDLMGKKTYADS